MRVAVTPQLVAKSPELGDRLRVGGVAVDVFTDHEPGERNAPLPGPLRQARQGARVNFGARRRRAQAVKPTVKVKLIEVHGDGELHLGSTLLPRNWRAMAAGPCAT